METKPRRIVIAGAGHVGSHAGYALISQGLAEEIVYIDVDEKKAAAQSADLSDATVYLPKATVVRTGDYSDARDAELLIVAAGPLPDRDKPQTRMSKLSQHVEIAKEIAENIRLSGFDGIILSISNPADVIARYIQTLLGRPPQKVFSTGTTLDSARLRRVLSETLGIDRKSIHGYVLGEHGESQMVAWSAVTVAGKPLAQLMEQDLDVRGKLDLDAIAGAARAGGWDIFNGKGSTEFGIGASIAEVVRAIFGDENRILPVSTLLSGQYGQNGVYASVPAVVNRHGVAGIIELALTGAEQARFDASCKILDESYRLALTL